MKRLLAILLSLCCLFLVGCETAATAGSESQSESSSQIEESTSIPPIENSNSQSEPESSSELEPEPTERNATLDDFLLISYEQTDNNCLLKFSVSDTIHYCVLRVLLYEEPTDALYGYEEYCYVGYLQKNKIHELKFAFYEDEDTKGKHFKYLTIHVVQGTVKLN